MALCEKVCTIVNERGLHARAAAKFVKCASKYHADIFIKKGDREVNGKSIMGILTLAAARGSQVAIKTEGIDAEEAIEDLATLIQSGFYEEER